MGRPPNRRTPPREIQKAEKRAAELVNLRNRGWTFHRIGEYYGITRQTAHEIYWRVIGSEKVQAVEEHRKAALARIEQLRSEAYAILAKEHVAILHGRVVVDEDGKPVTDDALRIAAIRELRQLEDREAKLLGLDVPVRQSVDVQVTETTQLDLAVQDLLSEVRARNAVGDESQQVGK